MSRGTEKFRGWIESSAPDNPATALIAARALIASLPALPRLQSDNSSKVAGTTNSGVPVATLNQRYVEETRSLTDQLLTYLEVRHQWG